MTTQNPFPSGSFLSVYYYYIATYIKSIKYTCKQIAHAQSLVTINTPAISSFVSTLKNESVLSEIKKCVSPVGYPLKFNTLEQEINFTVLMSMLQFGSGYRDELHTATKRVRYI
jgi:hypothetical protein